MKVQVIPWEGKTKPKAEDLRARLEEMGYFVYSWKDSAETSYVPHSHDEDEMIWVYEGAIEFVIDGKKYFLKKGDRLVLPRGTVHEAFVPTPHGSVSYLIGHK